MKKLCLLIAVITLVYSHSFAQTKVIDSLKQVLKDAKDDTVKINNLNDLAYKLCRFGRYDSSILVAGQAKVLSEKMSFTKGVGAAFSTIAIDYYYKGDYVQALAADSATLANDMARGDKKGMAGSYGNFAIVYGQQGQFDKALEYVQKSLKINIEVDNKYGIGSNYVSLANIYNDRGDYTSALQADNKGLEAYRQINNAEGIATIIGNMGLTYSNEGNYPMALEKDLLALHMYDSLGLKSGIARNLANVGSVYRNLNDSKKALEYDRKALTMFTEMGKKASIANTLGNMAIIYAERGSYDTAIDYFSQELKINQAANNMGGIQNAYLNLGAVYHKKLEFDKALDYFNKALELDRQMGDEASIGNVYTNMGNTLTAQKKFAQAKVYLDSALLIAKKIGDKNLSTNTYEYMCVLDSVTKNDKQGLLDYKAYIVYRDSLTNEENTRKTTQAEMNYEFAQKQAVEKAEQDKKDAITEDMRRKQLLVRNAFIAGFIIMLVIAFLILRGYRQKKKANEVITQQKTEVEKQKAMVEEQKAMVEQKNKDILDSITYAKRLQDAILPPLSIIKQYLPESFVMYKPKDIVAGDFYWMERVGDTILIAAADCTGHGVPGALVSVVCSNALNRTVKEFNIIEPGKILDKVRELVLETFEKSEDNVQDGMDISLASLTPSKGGMKLTWAGAYNSLWYLSDGKILEVPADKQPIGKSDNQKPFITHTITLNPPSEGREGTALYLFTDGYADQFGGEKGKKFKYKQLQELLLTNANKAMDVQKKVLEETLESWKGNLEQVDDILVIGIKV